VGTSAGALNGAFIASRPQTVETTEALADVWRELRRGQVFPLNPFTGLLGFLGARNHLVPDSGLRRLVSSHIQCEYLQEMTVQMLSLPLMSSPVRKCACPPGRSSTR
jgi:NTE family protein